MVMETIGLSLISGQVVFVNENAQAYEKVKQRETEGNL